MKTPLMTDTWRVLETKKGFEVQRTVETKYTSWLLFIIPVQRTKIEWMNVTASGGRPHWRLGKEKVPAHNPFKSLKEAYAFIAGLNPRPVIHPYPPEYVNLMP